MRSIGSLLLALLAAGVAGGQEIQVRSAPVQAVAVARHGAIVVDGRLDETDWALAVPATAFRQHDPDEGQPATQRTEVRFLYDGDALYIGARMHDDAGAAGVRSRLARRDAAAGADNLMFVFDTYHDHVGRTVLRIDPAGVQYDALSLGRADPDPAWDAVWESATRIDSLGWTAELRIPFSQLRLAGPGPQTWGLQIWRYEQRRNETSQWAFWTKRDAGGPPSFGHLTGLAPALHLVSAEAVPYVSIGVGPSAPGDANLARHSSRAVHAAGADVRLHGAGATATLTLDPDFGQVELDPAVLNLTTTETFFPEKRPFFVQDAGVFGYGSIDCFACNHDSPLRLYYSRRIGRPPSLRPAGTVVDAPGATRILAAARATLQSRDGWTVGALGARTDREVAVVLDTSTRSAVVPVEPAATYLVGRAEKRAASGDASIGVVGTLVDRSLTERSGDALATILPSRAATAGLDADQWWGNHVFHLTATTALSSVSGDSMALQHMQASSTHYFLRPGRQTTAGFFDTRYDPARRELRGYAGTIRIAKDAGAWTWEGLGETVSPGFEANDAGFVPVAGTQWLAANVRRSLTSPRPWYHYADLTGGAELLRNFDGDAIAREYHLTADVTTPSYWDVMMTFRHLAAHYDDRLLHGGETVAVGAGDSVTAQLTSDTRRAVSIATSAWWSADRSGDRSAGLAPAVVIRPTDALLLSVGVRAEHLDLGAQFASVVRDSAPGIPRDRRIVAALHQRTAAVELRGTAALTTTLSLDAYLQPFVTAGAYGDFGEFVTARAPAHVVYGRDAGTIQRVRGTDDVTRLTVDPDGSGPERAFTLRDPSGVTASLRGTAVLRWEYRPGAAVFLAWTQTRLDPGSPGAAGLGAGGRALVRAAPVNALLLKATYRLGR